MIYFIQIDGGNGLIKIGYAVDIQKRIGTLQTYCPYEIHLCGWIYGDRAKERQLHRRFEDLKKRGEWFLPGKSLLRYIQEETNTTDDPPQKITGVNCNFRVSDELEEKIKKAMRETGLSFSSIARLVFSYVLDRLDDPQVAYKIFYDLDSSKVEEVIELVRKQKISGLN